MIVNLQPGMRVVVRDAFNKLHAATIHARGYDRSGTFPKWWVTIRDSGELMPWPAEDVFADMPSALRRKEAVAGRES